MRHANRASTRRLGLLALVFSLPQIGCTDDEDTMTPQSSSVSHWVVCRTVSDCEPRADADACVDGYCVDEDGERLSEDSSSTQTDSSDVDTDTSDPSPAPMSESDPDESSNDVSLSDGSSTTIDDAQSTDPTAATDEAPAGGESSADAAVDEPPGEDTDGQAPPVEGGASAANESDDVPEALSDGGTTSCELAAVKACTINDDCVVRELVDCCGTTTFVGVAAAEEPALERLVTECEPYSTPNACACETLPTTAEDGASAASIDETVARCVSGSCASSVVPTGISPPAAEGCEPSCAADEVCVMQNQGGPLPQPRCAAWAPCRSAGICDCIVEAGTCTPQPADAPTYCYCDMGQN